MDDEIEKEGWPVKETVSGVRTDGLKRRRRLSARDRDRRQDALNRLDEIRARLPQTNVVDDLIDEIREQRS